MPSRQEIARRKNALLDDLRRIHREGSMPPGAAAHSQRSLAERYGLSVGLVGQMLRALIDEGVLYSVPRVGTFVGKPPGQFDVYLLTFHHNPQGDEYLSHIQIGFEERVAQLGGVSLRLTEAEAQEHQQNNELPPLAGLCHMGLRRGGAQWWPQNMPLVEFGVLKEAQGAADRIHFDDVAGGRQAARHLLAMGHKKIAYLGLHAKTNPAEPFFWSVEREIGWAEAMRAAGCPIEGLAFHPKFATPCRCEEDLPGHEQIKVSQRVAKEQLVMRRDITAIVTANSVAAEGLLVALDEANIAAQDRPAILCFDDVPSEGRSVVSYLRLPWDEVGGTAAQLLWERKTGQLSGPPVQRLVPMRLIPRLTCRPHRANAALTRSRSIQGGGIPGTAHKVLNTVGV